MEEPRSNEDLCFELRTSLLVGPWPDPKGDEVGVDVRSHYVETYWLPVLGPTATWLLRRMADGLDREPEGFELDLLETARGLGLGWSPGRTSLVRRAFDRCVHFKLMRAEGDATFVVRQRVGEVPRRHLMRLPTNLQEQHRMWIGSEVIPSEAVRLQRRARLVALDLRDLGADDACIERHLLRRGVHPATAFDAARWACKPGDPAER